jgi:hypothetical protein
MKYHIKIKDTVVYRTPDFHDALKTISNIFRDGHTDVYLHGGKIGKWWNN